MSAGTPAAAGPDALEELLGDPFDPANPAGYRAAVDADDAGSVADAATRALDTWGAGAEFVPASLGGRFTAVDELARRFRPAFRRDAGLGLGYGLTSLMAALPVWTAGTGAQRERLAALLAAGHPVPVAFHELGHGNDLSANALAARPTADGWLLDGTKQVINNADRAGAVLVLARTRADDGPERAHTLLLVEDLDDLPAHGFTRLPRYRTTGLAGCRLAGLRFTGCPVPRSATVGTVGHGVPTALAAFQVSRCVTAAASTSLLEAALDAVLRFAGGRELYGRTVADLPHARSLLAGAYADLHLAQATATTAARALHLHPAGGARIAAAAKYLVPLLVEDALNDLAVVLGARGYLREGEYAIVGKHLRDAAGVSIGHAGGTSCALTVLGQLPGLRPAAEPPDPDLFSGRPLPELDLSRLRLTGPRADPLLAVLADPTGPAGAAGDPAPRTRELLAGLTAAARTIGARAAALPAARRGVEADHRALALADEYARLVAAASCLGRYAAGRADGSPGGLPPGWLDAVLRRVVRRRGRHGDPGSATSDSALLTHAAARTAAGLSLDLDPDRVVRHRPHPPRRPHPSRVLTPTAGGTP
ncbi:acyl-CoA dehydrogenase family protein [Pseudonocardia alni]|uniref:acyl-CoA dehydrogenase family protein n=1 Tax=Pseudonocardia alni TaxID=33907 RepID=UPI0036C7AC9D